MELSHDPADNEMYQLKYLINKGTFLLCSKNHDLSNKVIKAIVTTSQWSVGSVALRSEATGLIQYYKADDFVSIQWVNKNTFPEYYL